MQLVRFLVFAALLFFSLPLQAMKQPDINSDFELVESIPTQTIYGQKDIRTTLPVWLDMVKEAHQSIEIASFYLNSPKDKPLAPFITALKVAASQGIKIKILLDSSFAWISNKTVQLLQNTHGIQIRYLPMDIITGGVMHAKYMLVDHQDIFVGSQNFDWKAINQIHEIGVRVRNHTLATTIERVFTMDWHLSQHHAYTQLNHWRYLPSDYNASISRPCQVNYNHEKLLIHPAFTPNNLLPKGLDWGQDQWVELLNTANTQVLMQVLQYSPQKGFGTKGYWNAFNDAIIRAAARGVKVKMIVSNWNLTYPAQLYLKSLSLLPNIQIKYSVVPQNNKGYISFARVEHAKYIVVDHDLVWIGNGNWQWSYFHTSRNIALIIQGQQPNQLLSQIFWRDWKGPYTHNLTLKERYHPPKHN